MSKKETKNTEQQKVMTKYDLKVQKRQAAKEQAKKDELKSKILGILLVVALAALVLSFPIRNYLTINGTYIVVDGEKISRVEYDYNYNLSKTDYISTYGTYLYYMGMDLTQNFDHEMYSQTRTWKDFFDELTVESIKQYKTLCKEGKAAGFTYDGTEEYEEYMDALEDTAKESGVTIKAFIQDMYGAYATEARIKPFVEEAMYASAYYNEVYDQKVPTQEEILKKYQENTDDYDSVDFYIAYVDAKLPTEPADGSAAAEDAENKDASTGTATGTDTSAGTTAEDIVEAYEPSEEEVAAAMAEAKASIEEKAKDIRANGNLTINVKKEDAVYILRDWLFAAERKEGDTNIVEDSLNSRYYAVEFVKRYLKETLSADIRVVSTADGNADAIYEEWKSGPATEDSFAEICDKYNDAALNPKRGGLYEGLKSSGLASELQEWIFNDARVAGDTAVIKPEGDSYAYVVYYVAPNRPEYILEIEAEITNERMADYLEELVADVTVEDPKDNLKYPERLEAEKLLSEEAGADTSVETPESSAASSSAQ